MLLSAQGVTKRFGSRVIFESAGLSLEAGAGYVLTGGNGAGKSTFMRILAGLEAAETGTLTFRGEAADIADYREAWRKEIIYVHQAPYLFHTTLYGNIEYGLARRGMAQPERHARVMDALRWSGLAEREKVPPQKLSGGEKQKAALARAKVLDPILLLLDEPTANLDGDARHQVLELVTELLTESHTVLVASHDPEIQRLAILNRLSVAACRIEAHD